MSSISIIAYIILALSISYTFVYSSMGDLNLLREEKQKYETTLETINNIENKKNQLLSEFENIPNDIKEDINIMLPDSFNFVRLVSQIDSVGSKYNIKIDKVSNRPSSSSSSGSIEDTQLDKVYDSAIVGFSFNAPYDKFNLFMGDLEKSLRILDIKFIKLSSEEKGGYFYNIEFETYWIK